MITNLLDIIFKVVDKIFPDKAEADKAKVNIMQLQQEGKLKLEEFEFKKDALENELLKEQIATNKIEAASDNLIKSGWRPMIGWACAFGVIYEFIFRPIANGILVIYGYTYIFPSLNSRELFCLLFSLLGMAGFRSYEKLKKLNLK